MVADYLGLEEESIIAMEDDRLSQLIEYNEQLEFNKKGNKVNKLKQKQKKYKKAKK